MREEPREAGIDLMLRDLEPNLIKGLEQLVLAEGAGEASFALVELAQALVELSSREEHAGIFARVHGAFDEQVARAGFVDEQGAVVVPLAWRLLAARRPL